MISKVWVWFTQAGRIQSQPQGITIHLHPAHFTGFPLGRLRGAVSTLARSFSSRPQEGDSTLLASQEDSATQPTAYRGLTVPARPPEDLICQGKEHNLTITGLNSRHPERTQASKAKIPRMNATKLL